MMMMFQQSLGPFFCETAFFSVLEVVLLQPYTDIIMHLISLVLIA
jgi:hypothetical protein